MKFEELVRIQNIRNGIQKRKALQNAGQNDLFSKPRTTPEDAARMYSVAARKAGATLQDWYSENGFRAVQFLKSRQK